MSPIAVAVLLGLYFLVLIFISRWTASKGGNADFYIGGRNSPWYLVAYGMIGASLSGVTFLSVPGWVGSSSFSYMQMVFGYFLGYLFISQVLLPVYYRMELTSIYGYLERRFGASARLTGSVFFLISRVIGASFRLYLVAMVLQIALFDALGVEFWQTVGVTILLIWVYTFQGGIKTIVWTDSLQTTFMLLAAVLSVIWLGRQLIPEEASILTYVREHPMSQMWFYEAASDKRYFFRQFLSGALITIVMTGLDQDMMQKNLSCRSLPEAQKNMFWFSLVLIVVNLLFLILGLFLHDYAQLMGIEAKGDELFPVLILEHSGSTLLIAVFLIGLIAAAYSSADSALTALTTSFCVDLLGRRKKVEPRMRMAVHVGFSLLLMAVVILFRYAFQDPHVINGLFRAAGFTYGPLLGLFAFGLLFKASPVSGYAIPLISLIAPISTWLIDAALKKHWDLELGYEVLALNGLLTMLLLLLLVGLQKKKAPGAPTP